MHNLDDNELDRLSRDAAEHYEPAAAPPAWDGLQKRLDREMPTRREGKDRKYWLLLLLLLLVGGGSALLYYSQNQHLETASAAADNKASETMARKSCKRRRSINGHGFKYGCIQQRSGADESSAAQT